MNRQRSNTTGSPASQPQPQPPPPPSSPRQPAPSMITLHGASGQDMFVTQPPNSPSTTPSSSAPLSPHASSRGHRRAVSMVSDILSPVSASVPFTPSSSSSPAAALLLDGASSPSSGNATGEVIPRFPSSQSLSSFDSPIINGNQTSQPQPRQQRIVEVSLEQVSDHQFLSLLKMKFKKSRRQELELKELQRLFVIEEEERRKLAEENAVLTRRLEEERRLREAADSLANALREDNQRLNSQIEELNLRLVEIITNVSHMGVTPAEKAKVLKKAPKP